MNNFLDVSTYKGMKIFKVFKDQNGEFLACPKYVAFRSGMLVGYYDSEVAATQGFLKGDRGEGRLEDFQGIDARLRG
jgi:hypothetical protein